MASHHHQLHPCHHHQQPPPATTVCTSTTCYCPSPPPPSPPPDSHLLLQSLISLLQNPNPNPPPCHCDPLPDPHPTHLPIRRKDPIFAEKQARRVRDSAAEALLASLAIRIDAVESALRRRDACVYGSSSVREAAARVIQIRFRAYLAGRSRSLRHLKDLAFIKARFNALKSSIVDLARVDPVAVSQKTVELLYKVDSIQDRDPMIVNGKRSLTRDLVGFLDYIDAIVLKRFGALTRGVKKVSVVQTRSGSKRVPDLRSEWRGLGRDRRIVIETLRGEVEDEEDEDLEVVSSSEEETTIPFQFIPPHVVKKKSSGIGSVGLGEKHGARIKGSKNVSFSDGGRNRNVISIGEPVSSQNGGSGSDGQREMLESLRKRVEEMEAGLAVRVAQEEGGDEEEESESGTSDGENRGATSSDTKTERGTRQQHQREDEEFTFPTPDHVKVDSRVGRSLKIKS